MEDKILQQILTELKNVREIQSVMAQGQANLERNIDTLKSDVNALKSDVDVLKYDVEQIHHSVTVIENVHGNKIDAFLDGMKGIQERFDRQDRLERRVEQHDERIFALEQVVSG